MDFAEKKSRWWKRDALRHCWWAAQVTRLVGADRARLLTDLHEHGEALSDETEMDVYNNYVGVLVGTEIHERRDLTAEMRTKWVGDDCRYLTEIGYLIASPGAMPMVPKWPPFEVVLTNSRCCVRVPTEVTVPVPFLDLPSRRN